MAEALTIIAVPKPFEGHTSIIQRNAITSWTLLRPKPQIILIGVEDGIAEIASELGVRRIEHVARNKYGTPLVDDVMAIGRKEASNPLLCYINCDIILMSDFQRAVEQATGVAESFMMTGLRWELELPKLWDFGSLDWENRLQTEVRERGTRLSSWGMDYFVFPKSLYGGLPALLIGRLYWDAWLVWKTRSMGVPVVDATPVVTAVHQIHPYSKTESWHEEGATNYRLAGGWWHIYSMHDATHKVTPHGIRTNRWHSLAPMRRVSWAVWSPIWWGLLGLTRPLRMRLGLRRHDLASLANRPNRRTGE